MIQTNFKYGVAGAFLVFAAGVFAGRFTAPNAAPTSSEVASEPTGATDSDDLKFDGTQSDMNDDASTMLKSSQAKMELALTELRAQANKFRHARSGGAARWLDSMRTASVVGSLRAANRTPVAGATCHLCGRMDDSLSSHPVSNPEDL